MADEKRQLILDILANAKTKSGTDKAARDLEDVADAADRANKSSDRLGKSTDELAGSQDRMGKSAQTNASHIESLNREIGLSKNELESMHQAYSRTADETERRDLGKGIRAMEGDLRRLTKTRDFLTKQDQDRLASSLIPDAKTLAPKLSDSLEGAFSALKSASFLGPVGAGMAVELAPLLGGAISGAVIGGSAGVGIVGGLLLATKDSRVKAAGADLGTSLMSGLQSRAGAFVEPVLSAIDKIKANFSTVLGPTLQKLFDSTSKYVGPLTDSILSAVDSIAGGIAKAAQAAGPVIDVIGSRLGSIGDAIGDMFSDLGKNGVSAASALDTALGVVEGTIRGVTTAIDYLTKAYGFLAQLGAFGSEARIRYWAIEAAEAQRNAAATKGATDAHGQFAGAAGAAGAAATDAAGGIRVLSAMEQAVADQADNSAKAVYGQRDALTALATAERAQSDPVFALLDAQQRLTKAQGDLSSAIKKHGENSNEARTATKNLTGAALDLQSAAGSLGQTFSGELTPQMRSTLHAVGVTDAQIDEVAASFRAAKRAGDAFAKTYKARVITEYINKYSSSVQSAADAAYAQTKASLGKRAAGGPVSRGTPYMVGEHGPEIVVPSAAGRVLSAAGTRGVAKTGIAGTPAGASAGGDVRTIRLEAAGGGDQGVATLINYLIRVGSIRATVAA